jgi:NADH dehydrogenase
LILVCGASGQLGSVVARKLLERQLAVRALSRDVRKLDALKALGAEVVQGDLMDRRSLEVALAGADRVFTSANSILGKGSTSPARIDRQGNRNLVDAARTARVRQFVFMSSIALSHDAVVDLFRFKVESEEYVKRSGVPWVVLQSAAFLDIWVPMFTSSMRKNGTATLFGAGANKSNYIAVSDVAEFAVRILTRDDVVNEVVQIGGPDHLTMSELLTHTEEALGIKARRRHIPLPVLRLMPPIIRPFNEVAARFMNLGYWSETTPKLCEAWRTAAERFGVQPMTVKEYLARSDL